MSDTRETAGKPVADTRGAADVLHAVSSSLAENSDAERIRLGTAELIEEMEHAIREAGVTPDEPLAPLLTSLKRALAWQGELTAENARVSAELASQTRRVLAEARAAADAEIERERAAVSADKAGIVRELSKEIAAATKTAQTWQRRTLDRNSLLGTAGAMAAALLLVGGLGYWRGHGDGAASVQATEDGLRAAFQHGPAGAAAWLGLMRANDPVQALQACAGAAAKGGDPRRACAVPMWLDPPTLNAPQR